MSNRRPAAETIAARLGGFSDPASGGVVPPMQPSTTFLRDEAYELAVAENSYGRDDNDQIRLTERVLSTLEGGEEALVFASGMAAISTLFSSLKRGQKLLIQSGIYWGTTSWTRQFCERREITLLEADSTATEDFCALIAAEQPDIIFVEVPSNPWIRVCDVPEISKAAHSVGAVLAVDATAATPMLFKPLEHGADIVIHSATKVINGHSDVLAGVLVCRDKQSDIWQFVTSERHGAGAILSAQSAWLLLRGIRTLPLRVDRMCSNALAVAEFLEQRNEVEAVWYPGLVSHADHALANQLMPSGYGYLMSFLIRGGRTEALEFCRHLRGIHRATSLGGTESLVEHRHTIEGALTGCPDNLIRLSVGIESADDLFGELGDALAHIKTG